jgi:hypothetical protein
MTVAALLAAALGGGIIAALLDAWFTNLRAYEIARLRVIDELDSINAMNLNLQHLDIYRMAFTAEELARLRYPTGAWTEGEPVMVIRLSRDHPKLLFQLSALYSSIALSPTAPPLPDDLNASLAECHRDLKAARLGLLGRTVVYGPRYALRRLDL